MSLVVKPEEIVRLREESGRPGLLARWEGWPRRKVKELCSIVNGAPFPSSGFNLEGKGRQLIRIRDVGNDSSDTFFDGPFKDEHKVSTGDILIGMDGDFRLARWSGGEALLNQRVCRLEITSQDVLDKFVELILPGYLEAIWQETSAITVKHLSSKSISDIPIPVPTIAEQEKIVEILEEQLARLDAVVKSVQTVREKAAQFRRSLFLATFSGAESGGDFDELPAGWALCELGEIAKWGSGGTPKSGVSSYYGGEIPWCVIGDLTESWVSKTEKSLTEDGLKNSSAKVIQPETVMLAMYGASIGRTGIAAVKMATNQAIAFAVPLGERVRPSFLLRYLQSQKDDFMRAGQGGAQPNISQTIIKQWPIPVPPVFEQDRLVNLLDAQLSRLQATLAVADEVERKVTALRRALLHAAFSGELTRSWREANV